MALNSTQLQSDAEFGFFIAVVTELNNANLVNYKGFALFMTETAHLLHEDSPVKWRTAIYRNIRHKTRPNKVLC